MAAPRLRRVDPSTPGIARRKVGRGFRYADSRGVVITDPEVLARIDALVIPPAWTDVWICPRPDGHVQATGVDAAGRRQYRYHDGWHVRRAAAKFDRMLEFGAALPAVRERLAVDLARPDMDRERVLACAVRLLDLGFFRIGSESYARSNRTYGLATMRKEHVSIAGDVLRFDYIAKSGKRRVQAVVDPAVVETVGILKRRRGGGPELLAYRRDGRWVDVRSTEINAYLREVTGGQCSAKDFRTWSATVLASVALAVSESAQSAAARQRAVARAVAEVSHYLGNTPAVCRSAYVDPRVVDRYLAGTTIAAALGSLGEGASPGDLATQGLVEEAVLDLLASAPRPRLVPAAPTAPAPASISTSTSTRGRARPAPGLRKAG